MMVQRVATTGDKGKHKNTILFIKNKAKTKQRITTTTPTAYGFIGLLDKLCSYFSIYMDSADIFAALDIHHHLNDVMWRATCLQYTQKTKRKTTHVNIPRQSHGYIVLV